MFSPHTEWYIGNVLVCAHFSLKLAHGTYCLCSISQLFRLLGIVYIFPMLVPKPCPGDLKHVQSNFLGRCGNAKDATRV